MLALRRASSSVRYQGLRFATYRAGCVKLDEVHGQLELKTSVLDSPQVAGRSSLFHHAANGSSSKVKASTGMRGLSSQAGTETGSSEDSGDDFAELEGPVSSGAIAEKIVFEGNEEEMVSDPDLSDDDEVVDIEEHSHDSLGFSDTETDPSEKPSMKKKDSSSELFNAIVHSQGSSVEAILDSWAEQGKDLGKSVVNPAVHKFRKRRMFGRALQLSEWLETNKNFDLAERDYASRLDLIAKVRGLHKAESFIETIPKSFRGEIIYRTLLANCVKVNDVKKAQEVFNKMKDLEFETSAFACNQLLLLYKRLDKKKIADVLLHMERQNVKPTLFTYKLLIDTKGLSNDISGMEDLVETMKSEGLEPDFTIQAVLAKHYAYGGLNDKAEAILKEMEGGADLKEKRWVCPVLLPLYSSLGKADEVERLWKVCESNPRLEECVAAVVAWGRLKRIDEAEAIFEMMEKKWKLSSRHYYSILKVYANNKMLSKGKDVIRKMGESGCRVGPLTWDALVKLYVEAGEVEKADSILHKAVQGNKMKPMFNSYMTIMDQYSKRGDIHNAEKIFFRMRQAGYMARLRQFQALVQTYVNAKVPAYGIRERMKADNIFPNKALAAQLAQVDAFRRTAASDLLD